MICSGPTPVLLQRARMAALVAERDRREAEEQLARSQPAAPAADGPVADGMAAAGMAAGSGGAEDLKSFLERLGLSRHVRPPPLLFATAHYTDGTTHCPVSCHQARPLAEAHVSSVAALEQLGNKGMMDAGMSKGARLKVLHEIKRRADTPVVDDEAERAKWDSLNWQQQQLVREPIFMR